MYDFGARNVVKGVVDAVKAAKETIAMVLQVGGKVHTEDMSDAEAVAEIRAAKGDKFTFAPASVGKNGIFDSAYHIKVAVRDSASVWLSSGNWQISNQPAIDPVHNPADRPGALSKYNREWHAILHDEVLAKLFEAHILRDLDEARAVDEAAAPDEQFVYVPTGLGAGALEAARTRPEYFEAKVGKRVVDVQPLLTPDNYTDEVVKFIRSATRSIHFQNQSFNTRFVGDNYRRLLTALLDQQKAGLDVKIIFRSFDAGDDRDVVTNARDFGFQDVASTIRSQHNCHTKGIIVDGEAVLLGSHNWTTAGTGFNRDASLIFFDEEFAQFYEKLFDFDWKRIGPMKIDESVPAPTLAPANGAVPNPGFVAVPVSEILGRGA
jgi:phosphatidylserine/phosphatidylglycerophosphate/cardiolipin synthase-like enzyme